MLPLTQARETHLRGQHWNALTGNQKIAIDGQSCLEALRTPPGCFLLGSNTHARFFEEVERIVSNLMAFYALDARLSGLLAGP